MISYPSLDRRLASAMLPRDGLAFWDDADVSVARASTKQALPSTTSACSSLLRVSSFSSQISCINGAAWPMRLARAGMALPDRRWYQADKKKGREGKGPWLGRLALPSTFSILLISFSLYIC